MEDAAPGTFPLRRTQCRANLLMETPEELARRYKSILDFDDRMEIDIKSRTKDKTRHLETIHEAKEIIPDESTPNGVDDVCLQYLGSIVPCDSYMLQANSGVFRELMKKIDLSPKEDGELPILTISTYDLCDSFQAFHAILEAVRTGTWVHSKAFEAEMSFSTCVSLYLIGVHWDIERLRKFSVHCMMLLTEYILDKPKSLLTSAEFIRQHLHLMSLVRAVQLAYRSRYDLKLWKTLYRCGEALAPKLIESPNFNVWIDECPEGKEYGRAIGIWGSDHEKTWRKIVKRRERELQELRQQQKQQQQQQQQQQQKKKSGNK